MPPILHRLGDEDISCLSAQTASNSPRGALQKDKISYVDIPVGQYFLEGLPCADMSTHYYWRFLWEHQPRATTQAPRMEAMMTSPTSRTLANINGITNKILIIGKLQ